MKHTRRHRYPEYTEPTAAKLEAMYRRLGNDPESLSLKSLIALKINRIMHNHKENNV